jgi:hypothetical protein
MVTTVFDWLNRGLGAGGANARIRVIFIVGNAARAMGNGASGIIAAEPSMLKKVRRLGRIAISVVAVVHAAHATFSIPTI